MFEVAIGDKTYRVCFEYYEDESRDPRDFDEDSEVYQMVRYTRANLFLMQGGEKIHVAFADTACAVIDNFVKEVGRKHALTRLLSTDSRPANLRTLTVIQWLGFPVMDKSTRSAFWSAYFGRQTNDRVKNVQPPTNGPYQAYLTDNNQIYSPLVADVVGRMVNTEQSLGLTIVDEAAGTKDWAKLAMDNLDQIDDIP